jgi:hypothetical protein
MDLALLKDKANQTVGLAVDAWHQRNPLLDEIWPEVFGHRIMTPDPGPPAPHGTAAKIALWGTATFSAGRFLRVCFDCRPLRRIFRYCISGGACHCAEHPNGRFPLEIRDTLLHFYQNDLDWGIASVAHVYDFAGVLVYGMMSAEQRDRFYDHVRIKARFFDDFRQYFLAAVDKNSYLDEPANNAKLAVIREVIAIPALKDRGPVPSFVYRPRFTV